MSKPKRPEFAAGDVWESKLRNGLGFTVTEFDDTNVTVDIDRVVRDKDNRKQVVQRTRVVPRVLFTRFAASYTRT